MIKRERYLNKLKDFKEKKLIKIVTGVRRSGKSTLFELYKNYLLETGVKKEQIIFINFEDIDFEDLLDYRKLHSYVKDKLNKDMMNYIFLDEIQNVKEFEKAVDSLYIKNNVDLYLTGSNAHMLSSEITTLLSGRYIEINILPLSFKEYVEYTGDKSNLRQKYNDYLRYSSFPYAVQLEKNKNIIKEYLGGIYNTVILKDVVARKKISDVMMLESVIKYIFDNIGNITSIKKIGDTMTSEGRKISTHTVENYISALIDSYIIYPAKRYDIKGKQHLKTLEKYYVVDIGLRYFLLGNRNIDFGRILENIVYLELKRRDYNIFIGKIDSNEVDFIAENMDEKIYYQVAASVRENATLKRELLSLQKINDNYPKYLVTLDEDPPVSYEGIIQMNVFDFLLEK